MTLIVENNLDNGSDCVMMDVVRENPQFFDKDIVMNAFDGLIRLLENRLARQELAIAETRTQLAEAKAAAAVPAAVPMKSAK